MTICLRFLVAAVALLYPCLSHPQQTGSPAASAFRLEIPALRAAQERQIGILLGGKNDAENAAILRGLKGLGKDCLSCLITVTSSPPVLAISSKGTPTIDFASISGDADGSVLKAEDCPKDKPFYSPTKKRCYKLVDFVKIAHASSTK